MNNLAHRIAACRNQKGLSQGELAKEVGVSLRTIQYWENPEASPPKTQKLRKLSEVLRQPIAYLLGGEGVDFQRGEHADAEERPPISEQEMAIREQCHAYVNEFLDACHGDPQSLSWTFVELKEKFPLDKWQRINTVRRPVETLPGVPKEVAEIARASAPIALRKIREEAQAEKSPKPSPKAVSPTGSKAAPGGGSPPRPK